MTPASRRRRLFPLRPRPLQPGRLLSAAAAAACTLLFLVLVLLSTTPSMPPSRHHVGARSSSPSLTRPSHPCGAASLGDLGDAMVSMLPKDLPFTVFAPSADAFRRVLNPRPDNASSARATDAGQTAGDDTDNANTYAVLSRVLGFSAVPRRLLAADVPPRGGARALESVSGLRIHVARDGARGAAALVANGVRSECVDVVRGETVVHVMAGVLMDAEFERSLSVGFDFFR